MYILSIKNKRHAFAYRLFSVMGSLPSADNSDLFFDLGSLADSVAQVEQLCASYLTVTDNFDTCNVGRVDRESLFDTATVGNTSYGECLGDAAAALSDNGSVKKLDSLTVAFLNTAVTRTVSPTSNSGRVSFNCSLVIAAM